MNANTVSLLFTYPGTVLGEETVSAQRELEERKAERKCQRQQNKGEKKRKFIKSIGPVGYALNFCVTN